MPGARASSCLDLPLLAVTAASVAVLTACGGSSSDANLTPAVSPLVQPGSPDLVAFLRGP